MSSIITGEAVVLELRPASFAARALGSVLDAAAYTALMIGVTVAAPYVVGEMDPAAQAMFAALATIFCFVVVPAGVETLTRGRSLGKLAAGLRIVRDDGGSIRFRHALIRALTGFVEIYASAGFIAIVVGLCSGRSKRLGDMLAGTYSLRVRVPVQPPVVLHVPPALESWAALADIGRIPDATARRALQFIQQAGRMAPASRSGMAAMMATEVAAFVAPQPPSGTVAEDFLAAVLAERRERELARLLLERERSTRMGERLNRLPYQPGEA
jgi:uncharacterized RDD family membrane protein YckC